jgi:hypothetical protein
MLLGELIEFREPSALLLQPGVRMLWMARAVDPD